MNRARFLELLSELKVSESSLSRIKVISEIWRFVSGLSSAERSSLMRELGLHGQEQLIERFLSSPGTRSDEILQLAEKMPEWVKLDQIERTLGKRTKDDPSSLPGTAPSEALQMPPRKLPPSPPEVPLSNPHPSNLERDVVAAPVPDESPLFMRETSAEASPQPSDLRAQEESERHGVAEVAENTPGPPVQAEVVCPPERPVTGIPVEPSDQVGDPGGSAMAQESASVIDELISILKATSTPSTRFLLIMREGKTLTSPSSTDVEHLLEFFPPGWMKRRVLMMLLRNGISAKTKEIITLIQRLTGQPSDYLWCAGQLVRTRILSKSELELLIEKAPNRSIERRIRNCAQTAQTIENDSASMLFSELPISEGNGPPL